ncbi:hypothetical protein [Sphingopyxis macrogoltabida]|uniref:Uncharacterized protein n=2 Tax=Sphingopyxis macrogoltabida TaxID=33050 RepID=A0AAC9AW36_SPHMC|nr:hypothetical protein [Sphingopyxis macrogoltabida]AMU90948.1 hypothetical protein ATM17_18170 [Sphingopyxis macrogoltabida]
MTISVEIERMVRRLEGVTICDNCITDRLNLSVPSQANAVTRSLAGQQVYERLKDACGLCGKTRTVIRTR